MEINKRILEKETVKIGDGASLIPGSQAEEAYYQDQLFRIEKQKIIDTSTLSKEEVKKQFVHFVDDIEIDEFDIE